MPRLPHQRPNDGPLDTIQLADDLVSLAAELVATVRDYGRDDVAAILARVPHGRYDALAIVLAGMVDPDRTPAQLLAWSLAGPVASRNDPAPRHLSVVAVNAAALGRRAERRAEVARLTDRGLTAEEIGRRLGITRRSVVRHRSALRAAMADTVARRSAS